VRRLSAISHQEKPVPQSASKLDEVHAIKACAFFFVLSIKFQDIPILTDG